MSNRTDLVVLKIRKKRIKFLIGPIPTIEGNVVLNVNNSRSVITQQMTPTLITSEFYTFVRQSPVYVQPTYAREIESKKSLLRGSLTKLVLRKTEVLVLTRQVPRRFASQPLLPKSEIRNRKRYISQGIKRNKMPLTARPEK